MAILAVTRQSSYPDRFRAYSIMLDDKKIGELGNNESKQFSIAPGPHKLSLKIDWCGSNTLDFNAVDGDTASFDARSNLRGLKIFLATWYILFDQSAYLLLEKSPR